ncbi:MAG: glycogen-binding domain-containing protein [Gemmatimonadota bacterium]
MRWAAALLLAGVATASAEPAPTAAQQSLDLRLDARATRTSPPDDAPEFEPATYALAGARTRLGLTPDAHITAAIDGGRAASTTDAWLHTGLGVVLERPAGSLRLGLTAEAFSLLYTGPFRYTARGVGLRPHLAASLAGTRLTLAGDWRRGGWTYAATADGTGGGTGLPPGTGPGPPGSGTPGGPAEDGEGTLSVTGLRLAAERPLGPGRVEWRVSGLEAENGTVSGCYRGLSAGYVFAVGRAVARVDARVQESPDPGGGDSRVDVGFGVGVAVEVGGGVAAVADASRTVPDALYGTPGALAAGLGVSWRGPVWSVAADEPVVAVGESTTRGHRVRFRVRAPDAERVALAGDFSGWEPVPMRRVEDAWVLELTLPPGLHQFAFLIDGDRWYVPDDAPGIVDDGWGRRNASIVIEEA